MDVIVRKSGGLPHQSAIYYGMIATGNHHYFNSLRGAPLVRNDSSSIWALCLFETAPLVSSDPLEIRCPVQGHRVRSWHRRADAK